MSKSSRTTVGVGSVVLFAILATLLGGQPAAAAQCSDLDHSIGACIGNGSVDIGGSTERPGSGGAGGDPGGGDWATGGGGTPGSNVGPNGERGMCSPLYPDACNISTPGDLGHTVQSVVIRDVASFAPDAPTVTTEPGGWGVIKLHTNVIANASGHVRSGTLLGQPAEVNFIPLGFTFDYGDGSTGSSSTGGDTWAALGLGEFAKTPTSHRYTTPGPKAITAVVTYAAEYRLGDGGWLPVIGTLDIPTATPHTVQIVRAATVGVDKPCTPGRKAVGC